MIRLLLPIFMIMSLEATQVPQIVLDAIQYTECEKRDGLCYPYVIRINGTKALSKAKALGYEATHGKLYKEDTEKRREVVSASMRFETIDEASAAVKVLIAGGVTNMDLGTYQINYKWFKSDDFDTYFSDASARDFAANIISDLIRRHGYSWETLGRYHSATPHLNQHYYKKLHKYIYGY
jgi:hypothetical protein